MNPKRLATDQQLAHSMRQLHERGFTLIELIMVIVILGVLAVFATPRIINTDDFNARGFHDETLALLRYAQKAAIAQRRTACVTFTMTTATLTIAAAAATSSCAGNPLVGPKGDSPGKITARSSVAYVAKPTDFSFDGLGQPSVSQSMDVSNGISAMGSPITVEAVTGFVHD